MMGDIREVDASRLWWIMRLGKDNIATIEDTVDDLATAEGYASRLNGPYDDTIVDARWEGLYDRAPWYFIIRNPYHHSVTRCSVH